MSLRIEYDERAISQAAALSRDRELQQLCADAARERYELRPALESRAQVLEEPRDELRARAERAERDLDAAGRAGPTVPVSGGMDALGAAVRHPA